MCISFAVIGSLAAQDIIWERVGAIAIIYALALGVSAHAADSVGSKAKKPWGNYFSKRQLLVLTVLALAAAYAIGLYYIVFFVPLLAPIAVLEGFFLFAYNFEILGGRFHNDFWFAVSWGALPVLAGYAIQTNAIDLDSIAIACATGLVSYLEIRLSRPYKELRRNGQDDRTAKKLEVGLKILSVGTIAFALFLATFKIIFS
jgi:uncharacterized membrane protein